MRNQDKISIIVPVYKVEEYLHQCIDSILTQSFQGFHLVLVDDGSPDNCGLICDEYANNDSRITVIHQSNGGLSAARNAGLDWVYANLHFDWITFIDSDDWLHPDYLRLLLDAATTNKADISICNHIRTSDREYDDTLLYKCNSQLVNAEDYWVKNRTNATTAWGKLYRKELFEKNRFPVGKYHEDEYVTYKLLFKQNRIAYVDASLYRYFISEKSISSMNYLKRFPDIIEAFKQHYDYFKDSEYQGAFRLEVEKYAEAYANAINWCLNHQNDVDNETLIKIRKELKAFLSEHKQYIPFEKRKDIYIAAYPNHKIFIRGFGFIKQVINGDR